jgi:hypothetical protein
MNVEGAARAGGACEGQTRWLRAQIQRLQGKGRATGADSGDDPTMPIQCSPHGDDEWGEVRR